MTFSQNKLQALGRQKERKTSTFLIALLTAAALFVPYIIMGRGYFVFFGDFNVQQIPFYKMCHAAVRSGSFGWSFTTDLGSNFVGSYAFYLLGSPFFWLTIPFPNDFVPYLMGPLLILKFACAALTAYLYIRRFTRTPEAARLGGILYAFSGFSVYNIFFNHFHEAIIVFPLLLLAMEYLITENRRGVFALAVCLCAVTNYFFFFGMTVFCIIYYVVRLTTGDIRFKLSRFLWLAFESVLGVAMAAALLVPAVLAILGNERVSNILLGWGAIMYGREQIYLNIIECFFFPPDLPARPVFFPDANVKWSSLGGWLPLFGMTGVISWFAARKKTWIKRLLSVCIFMSLVPILNSAFYAFNGSYYARWFYMPVLIMCLATVRVCEEENINIWQGFRWTAVITAAIALAIGLFPRRNEEGDIVFGLFTESQTLDYKLRFWGTAAIAIGSLAVLALFIHVFRKNKKRFILVTTAFVCAVAAVYGNFFIALGRMHAFNIDEGIINSLIEGEVQLEGDKSTFRIDTYDCVDNTAMYLGYSSINAFHSVVPPSIMEFYKYIEIKRDVGSRPGTEYAALRPLLSVKYLVDRKDDEKSFVDKEGKSLIPGFEYIKTSNGFYVYENKSFVGYGFSTDYYMTEEFLQNYSGPQKARMMLKGVLLTKEQAAKYADILTDLNDRRLEIAAEQEKAEKLKKQQEEQSRLEEEKSSESVETDEGSPAAESADDESDADESAAAQSEETPETAEQTASMATVSELIEEEKRSNKPTLDLDDEQLEKDAARLAATSASSFTTDNGGFTATVERDKKSLVIFTVPYDEGWTATVNGKPAEIEKVDVGFMAVAVEAGQSTVRFDYETPGLNIGIMITGGAFAVFVIYFIISTAVIKKRKKAEDYPEGERLISQWKTAHIAEEVAAENDGGTEDDLPQSMLDGLDKLAEKPLRKEDISGGFEIDKDLFDD